MSDWDKNFTSGDIVPRMLGRKDLEKYKAGIKKENPMTKQTDLQPGPELDALIAEKVMGWIKHRQEEADDFEVWSKRLGDGLIQIMGVVGDWNPSKFMDPAWEVVEKVIDITDATVLITMHEDRSVCTFSNPEILSGHTAVASKMPHAICLAALKAMGVE